LVYWWAETSCESHAEEYFTKKEGWSAGATTATTLCFRCNNDGGSVCASFRGVFTPSQEVLIN